MRTEQRGNKTFDYFHGSALEMAGLAAGEQKCTFCGQTETCFLVEEAKHGCFGCLRRGRFLFDHNTEIGRLTPDGMKRVYPSQKQIPDNFNRAVFSHLLRTPQFTTWQGEEWLAHCDDFMIYLGEWKPEDFHRRSSDGEGRKLFLEMTADGLAHLWSAAAPEGANGPDGWYATYYAFKCRRCGVLRGYWDCP